MSLPHANTRSTSPGHDIVDRALRGLYKPECWHTKNVRAIGFNTYETTFVFPGYTRCELDMGHVSANQTNEALMESVYCAMEFSLFEGTFPLKVKADSMRAARYCWMIFQQNITYRKLVISGEEVLLTVSIVEVGQKRISKNFISAIFDFDGFVSGQTEWLLPLEFYPGKL